MTFTSEENSYKDIKCSANPEEVVNGSRHILYKEKRLLFPGEYFVEVSIYNE